MECLTQIVDGLRRSDSAADMYLAGIAVLLQRDDGCVHGHTGS